MTKESRDRRKSRRANKELGERIIGAAHNYDDLPDGYVGNTWIPSDPQYRVLDWSNHKNPFIQ